MFRNRLILVIGVLSLLLVTMAVSFFRPKTSLATDQSASDFYQRHPQWTSRIQSAGIPITGLSEYLDYYQRHPELNVAAGANTIADPMILNELAQVRQATAKYHDVNAALADGFIQTPACVESPEGGMGIHFINPARLVDSAVNILEPEILLYVKSGNGLKLLGVEYMFAIGAPDTHVPDPAPPSPMIFGRPLDGPMEQHEPGQPPHYDLHVWLWQANPSGIFVPFNPNVHCK